MCKCTKILAGALALLLLIGAVPASAKSMEPFVPKKIEAVEDAGPKLIIIEDGKSDYAIVRGAQVSPTEVTAAEKLQEYLERIGGCVLPIVTDEQPAQAKEIVVGRTNRYAADYGDLGDEGFVINTVGESIVIAGGEKRGALYGVFDFLEKFLGCRWLTSVVTVVPEMATVAVPAEIDVLEKPAFSFRNPIVVPYLCASIDYCLANRINTGTGQVAIGRSRPGVVGIGHSYEEALNALDVAQRMGFDEPLLRAADLLVFPVLARDRQALVDLVGNTLGPLEQARGGARPLLETLAAYFDTGCVAAETARRLSLSVRALTYRLARVHAMTDYDPTDPVHRYTLQTAVIGARLLDWPSRPL